MCLDLGGVELESDNTRKNESQKFSINIDSGDFQRALASLTYTQEIFQNIARMISESIRQALSKIELPQIQYPDFPKIDWESFHTQFTEECKSNAKYGWCVSANMCIGSYREIARTKDTQEHRDSLFQELFEKDNSQLYFEERDDIITSSPDSWKKYYENCFLAFENGMYVAVIPSLMSAIEYELATISNDNEIGKSLINKVKARFENDTNSGDFSHIVGASVISLLQNGVFKYQPFELQRPKTLNRNWILHGRDDPSKWKKSDVYKLMSIISAIKLVLNNSIHN